MVRHEDLREFFGVSRSTIYRWYGDVVPQPHYYKGAKIPYWNLEDIKAMIPNFTNEALEKLRELRSSRKAAKKKAQVAM